MGPVKHRNMWPLLLLLLLPCLCPTSSQVIPRAVGSSFYYSTSTCTVERPFWFFSVLRVHKIIRIRGSIPLTNGSSNLQDANKMFFFYYFCLMIEGSGSWSMTNESGSGRPEYILILRIQIRIRIRDTVFCCCFYSPSFSTYFRLNETTKVSTKICSRLRAPSQYFVRTTEVIIGNSNFLSLTVDVIKSSYFSKGYRTQQSKSEST
jgi:hypothetical protein